MDPIKLASIETFAFRVPTKPIKVSFGIFRDRPCVLVRVVDADGQEGWGEVWCNWPAATAEYRARLAADVGERLIGRNLASPDEAFHTLTKEMEVLVLQTGESGPIAAAIAGIDIAIWDLSARRTGVPLHRHLGGDGADFVPVYATGINPDQPEEFAAARYREGHRAFKLKIGFGREIDVRNLANMRKVLGSEAKLMCDANQALSLSAAIALSREIAPSNLSWLEEPLRVDAPAADWRTLAAASPIELAGGENLQGEQLEDAVTANVFGVLQPDVTKWGGITGNLGVACAAVAAGKRFCPHYFGGGIALLASLHLLATAGGEGVLEFDCHPNASREIVIGSLLPVRQGRVPVPTAPGLGSIPDLRAFAPYRTWPQ
jgi:L-alanine-DL-glutamate epimerase-like enolase superfamily enzyme